MLAAKAAAAAAADYVAGFCEHLDLRIHDVVHMISL